MDLGIAGRTAIIGGASKGLGRACAMALARDGVNVVISARRKDELEKTAGEIRAVAKGSVTPVAADYTTTDGRAAILAACPKPDIVVNNAGGPPPGHFKDWTRDDWIKAIDANMLSAIEMIKATIDHMVAQKFGRIVNVTSGAVKAPIPVLGLSNGARSGLTGFVAGIAREYAKHNVTINNLLPGPFETDRLISVTKNEAAKQGISFEEMRARRMAQNPAGRFGQPDEFGAACAFLCSAQAGFIVGQNMLLDGGFFPGTF
jgi:3-oxoacyl-[acyl-carrier protein] reductase